MKKRKGVIIERATLKDLPRILELQDKQAAETKKFANNLGKKGKVVFFSKSEIRKIIMSSKDYPVVAKVDDRIVGCGFVRIEKAPSWAKYKKQGYMGALYVDKKYRKQGIARAVQEEVFEWLKSKEIRLCACAVLANNISALNLQKKRGFLPHSIDMYKELK